MVLGGSGLLGRAVLSELHQSLSPGTYEVIGTAFSRPGGPGFLRLDVTEEGALEALLHSQKPKVVVNCIAERRPDVVDRELERTRQLNVQAVETIAKASKEQGFFFVHLSTDYVFDGTSPPYKPEDAPNPLQEYGVTKLAG